MAWMAAAGEGAGAAGGASAGAAGAGAGAGAASAGAGAGAAGAGAGSAGAAGAGAGAGTTAVGAAGGAAANASTASGATGYAQGIEGAKAATNNALYQQGTPITLGPGAMEAQGTKAAIEGVMGGNGAGGFGVDAAQQTAQSQGTETQGGWLDMLKRFQKGGSMDTADAYKNFGNNPETYGYLMGKMGQLGNMRQQGQQQPMVTNISYQPPENAYLKRRGY